MDAVNQVILRGLGDLENSSSRHSDPDRLKDLHGLQANLVFWLILEFRCNADVNVWMSLDEDLSDLESVHYFGVRILAGQPDDRLAVRRLKAGD